MSNFDEFTLRIPAGEKVVAMHYSWGEGRGRLIGLGMRDVQGHYHAVVLTEEEAESVYQQVCGLLHKDKGDSFTGYPWDE